MAPLAAPFIYNTASVLIGQQEFALGSELVVCEGSDGGGEQKWHQG